MFNVMVVDDEKAAIQYMENVIRKKCPGFQVVGTAFDGKELLSKIRDLNPDVCVFDINMPILNGIEMAKQIIEWDLPTILVIVSGYSEFEFARSAMKLGVVEYLLKPVMPDTVAKLFAKIEKRLLLNYYKERKKILSCMYHDIKISEDKLQKYFGKQKFFIALGRVNGLPLRFNPAEAKEVFSDIHETLITYGRDERENIILCPELVIGNLPFDKIVSKEMDKMQEEQDYCTCILSKIPLTCTEIRESAKKMYQVLHNNVVLGKTQYIWLEQYVEKKINIDEEEKRLLNDFSFYIEQQVYLKAQSVIKRLLAIWEKKDRSLLWVERRIRSMINKIEHREHVRTYDKDYVEDESTLEETFANAQNWEQLELNLLEIMFKDPNKLVENSKLDTEEFIDEVCNYIKEHLEKELRLQEVGKRFGVSQDYLGKLFRKYRDMSFNAYVTMTRMEVAKLLLLQKDILIKDIAYRLGFRDQFYFSRVFRSYTGVSPSEFLENEVGEGP